MRKWFHFLLFTLSILLLQTSFGYESIGKFREEKLNLSKPIFIKNEPIVLDKDTYYYVNPDNEVIVQRGKKKIVLNKDLPKEGDYGFLNAVKYKKLYVVTFWHRNPPVKNIYVVSLNPETLGIVSFVNLKAPDPLGKTRFFKLEDKLFIAWYDEKVPYKTYVSYTKDGRNWSKPIELGPSTDTGALYEYDGDIFGVTLACEPKKVSKVDNKTKVEEWRCGVFRATFKNDKFSEPKLIFEDPFSWKMKGTPYNLHVIVDGKRVFFAYNVGGFPRIALSEDNKNFSAVSIPEKWLTTYNLSDITLFVNGKRLLVIGEARPTPDRLFITKDKVAYNARWQPYALYSEDLGKTWKEKNLFGEHLNYEFFFSAFPYRAKQINGKIIVSWMDFRYIVPIPFITVSKDFGKTWSTPSPVVEPYKIKGFYPNMDYINGEYILWFPIERKIENSTEREYTLGIVELSSLDYKPLKDSYSEEYKDKSLKKAIEEFKKAQISGDSKKIYSFFDPVFKELFPYPIWESTRIKGIKFLEKKILSVTRVGNLAVVESVAKVELPKNVFGRFEVKGNRITTQKMYDIFVFIDGKWYVAAPKIGGGYYVEW